MSVRIRIPLAILWLFLASGSLYAQSPQRNALMGTWKVTAIGLPNQPQISSPQPGLYIFTPKYYSIIRINSNRPDALSAAGEEAKDQGALVPFEALTAEAGTYTVAGYHLRLRPLTANDPSVITGPESEYEFEIRGRSILITSIPADGSARSVVVLTRLEY